MSIASPKNEAHRLPTPDEIPGADIVVFDGDCQFCQAQVRRLYRWDGKRRLAFLSLHDPAIAKFCPDLTHDELMLQMYVVRPDGQTHGGAAAFRYLSRRLPRLWLLAPLMHIPGSLPLWSWCYHQVARRRYRWNRSQVNACANDSCSRHLGGDRRRGQTSQSGPPNTPAD